MSSHLKKKKNLHISLCLTYLIYSSREMHHSLLYETPNDVCMFNPSLNKNSILTQKFNADHILSCGAELHALKPQHWCSKYESSAMNEWYVLVVKMHLQGESGSGFLEKPPPGRGLSQIGVNRLWRTNPFTVFINFPPSNSFFHVYLFCFICSSRTFPLAQKKKIKIKTYSICLLSPFRSHKHILYL